MLDWSKRTTEQIITISILALTLQGVISAITDKSFFVINATTQLEICFFIVGILNFNPIFQGNFIFSLVMAITLITCILLSKNADTSYYDSAKAVKWLAYLVVIWSSSSNLGLDMKLLNRIYKIMISSALVSYLVQIIRDGFMVRPILFTENNYEISFFSGIFILLFFYHRKSSEPLEYRWYFVLLLVIALSGSRSGAIAGLLITFYVFKDPTKKNSGKLLKIGMLGIAATATFLIFIRRGSSFTETDRFSFFQVFISETQSQNLLKWIFGNFIITPLSDTGCTTLNYYQILVSDRVYGTCYSVILHSFILRIIWDFGILGLLFSFIGIYLSLARLFPKPLPHILTFLALANAASVSGPNNVYVVYPILLAILSARNFISDNRKQRLDKSS